ncbi:MAG: hypothetical protein HY617_00125 [Candidatus Sungbacteria bacterium]|nr:hypothetical protein [Candidatus Sungbacteria bacterium]
MNLDPDIRRTAYLRSSQVTLKPYYETRNGMLNSLIEGEYGTDIQKSAGSGAFSGSKCIFCIDEGLPPDKMPAGIHVPGSLIGWENADAVNFIKEHGVVEITSHPDCAAGKKYAHDYGLNEDQADAIARQRIQSIARQANIRFVHIVPSKLRRELGFHPARICYYIGSQYFDPRALNMPQGFMVSRRFLSQEIAQNAALLAFQIASGPKGYDTLISDHPFKQFMFIAVGARTHDRYAAEALMAELEDVTRACGKRAIVRGLSEF